MSKPHYMKCQGYDTMTLGKSCNLKEYYVFAFHCFILNPKDVTQIWEFDNACYE